MAVLCLLLAFCSCEVVFMSPFGADSNNGSLSSPVRTLHQAMMAAKNNGVVFVMAGSYSGTLNTFHGAINITIAAHPAGQSPDNFVFDAQGQRGNVFNLTGGHAIVTGITFQNGFSEQPIGLVAVGAGATMEMQSCQLLDNDQYAMTVEGTVTLFDSLVSGVQFIVVGHQTTYAQLLMTNVTSMWLTLSLKNNAAVKGQLIQFNNGSIIAAENAQSEIYLHQTLFVGQSGVACILAGKTKYANIWVTKSVFAQCSPGIFASGNVRNPGQIQIEDTTFQDNTNFGNGGGLSVQSGMSVQLKNVVFFNNTVSHQGGGIWCSGTSTINGQSLVFNSNTAYNGAAAWCGNGCSFFASNVTTTSNSQTESTGPCSGVNY